MESSCSKRQKILSIALTILILLLIVVNVDHVTAQSDIEVILDEPTGDVLMQGSEVKYRLNVKMPANVNDYKNLYITLRLSEGLSLTQYELKDKAALGNKVDIMSTAHSDARYSYITLRVNDLAGLQDRSSLAVDIYGIVNNRAKVGSKIVNSYTVSYQAGGNNPVSYQSKQESNGKVVDRNYKENDNVTTLVDDNEIKNYEENNNKEYGEHTPLNILSGRVYADFMNTIKGYTDPNAKVTVKFLSTENSTMSLNANSNGEFTFKLPTTSTHPIIVVTAKSGNKATSNDYILNYVSDTTIHYDDLLEMIDNLNSIGLKDTTMKVMEEINKTMALTNIAIMSDDPPAQMIYEAYRDLYFASLQGEALTEKVSIVHEPYISGYPEGNFIPGGQITRAEISAMLSRIIANGEVVNASTKNFNDVESSKWYSKYIAHMEQVGLMTGYSDGSFKPGQAVTRAELATIVSRYKNLVDEGENKYSDLDLNFWAARDILRVSKAGYVEGYPDGTFMPQNKVTRAEAVTMVNRVLKRNPDINYINSKNIKPFSDISRHWSEYQIIEASVEHVPSIVNESETSWISSK